MIVIRLQVIVQAKSRKFKGFAWKMKNFFDDFANVCIPPRPSCSFQAPSSLSLPFFPACRVPSFFSSSLLCLLCPFPILPHYFLSFISCSFPAPYLLSFLLCLSAFLFSSLIHAPSLLITYPPCLFVIYPSPFSPFLPVHRAPFPSCTILFHPCLPLIPPSLPSLRMPLYSDAGRPSWTARVNC